MWQLDKGTILEEIFKTKNDKMSKVKEVGISSDEVLLAKSLVCGKCRDKDLFVCEGLWAAEKLIEKKIDVELFLMSSDAAKTASEEDLKKIAKMADYASKSAFISSKSCQKISDRDGYDEFFIVARQPKYTLDDIEKMIEGKSEVLAVVMDGLEQPGNVGAILRSFDACGGTFAVLVSAKAKLTSSRLVRSSLGASFMIPTLEADIGKTQEFLEKNGFKCIVTDLSATKSYKDVSYGGKIAIISGNEHTGISPSWRTMKNAERVIIPMLGSVESLNVGFATTLVAYEAGLSKFNKK